jgi:hypothetical protein
MARGRVAQPSGPSTSPTPSRAGKVPNVDDLETSARDARSRSSSRVAQATAFAPRSVGNLMRADVVPMHRIHSMGRVALLLVVISERAPARRRDARSPALGGTSYGRLWLLLVGSDSDAVGRQASHPTSSWLSSLRQNVISGSEVTPTSRMSGSISDRASSKKR